ncbi:MAG: hypothetical protein JWL77_4267 [Chthonomonadaceae bacterium]|nr:hypothetical protein [Chthonomonadaceae bacterium]
MMGGDFGYVLYGIAENIEADRSNPEGWFSSLTNCRDREDDNLHPLDKVERLRHLTAKTAHLTELANSQGMDLSPLNAVCMSRYLALVEGILRSCQGSALR